MNKLLLTAATALLVAAPLAACGDTGPTGSIMNADDVAQIAYDELTATDKATACAGLNGISDEVFRDIIMEEAPADMKMKARFPQMMISDDVTYADFAGSYADMIIGYCDG